MSIQRTSKILSSEEIIEELDKLKITIMVMIMIMIIVAMIKMAIKNNFMIITLLTISSIKIRKLKINILKI